jgi:hypothetical protein
VPFVNAGAVDIEERLTRRCGRVKFLNGLRQNADINNGYLDTSCDRDRRQLWTDDPLTLDINKPRPAPG